MARSWRYAARLGVGIAGALSLMSVPKAGATIVYAHHGPPTAPGGIWVMNDDGSAKRELIPERATGAGENLGEPSVDPRGGIVLFTGHGAIWKWERGSVVNLTSELKTVAGGGDSGFAFSGNGHAAALGDGTFVWEYTYGIAGAGATEGHTYIKRAHLDGKAMLPDIPRSCGAVWQDASPAPRPGGGIAYLGCSRTAGSFPYSHTEDQIMLIKPSGEQTELATAEDATFESVSWNPAGSRVVAVAADPVSLTGKFAQSIYVLDVGGAAHQILAAQNGLISSPRFIGESRIVFGFSPAGSDGRSDLYSVPVTCSACGVSAATRLTTDGASTEPAWTATPLTGAASARDGVTLPSGQKLGSVMSRGLRLTVVCTSQCLALGRLTIDRSLAKRLGLKSTEVAKGSLPAGTGSRTLTVKFAASAHSRLSKLRSLKLGMWVRTVNLGSGKLATYTGSTTLRR